MSKFTDIEFRQDSDGLFDIHIGEDGDLETTDSLDTAILMSIFCERRASPSEVQVPLQRRGWWGNETGSVAGFELGSKIWILYRSRLTQDTINEASDYAQSAFQWMIEDNLLDNVTAEAEKDGSAANPILNLRVTLFRSPNQVESRLYQLWDNTGRAT